jgi:xylulokinase
VPLYLGFDSSTQSLTAVGLEVLGDRRRIVFESSLLFDEALPHYGTRHGVLPNTDPAVAHSSPLMWAEALELMVARLAHSDLELDHLAAISGSAQQHGSVYLNARAAQAMATTAAGHSPLEWLPASLSRSEAPIWMDSSTAAECAELTEAVGGSHVLARHTGSRAFERFTAAQIRKFFKQDPTAYAATDRIHLVSSFLASLLVNHHASLDPGDGSGTNLMDLRTSEWWPIAVDATAPDLLARLPAVTPASSVVGTVSRYWQSRYGLPPAKVIAWTGDNPSSLVGIGLVREGLMAISLGTSDTIFGLMHTPRVDPSGTGHVFGSPTGAYMGLTVFSNGSLARERVRNENGLTWDQFSHVLDRTPAGNGGRILLPWFRPEITPTVLVPGVRRYGLEATDREAHVRGVVEAQMMSLALHSRWMGVEVRTIFATGGATANLALLRIMADVFGADVYQSERRNTACLGAALRAFQGDARARGEPWSWEDIVRDVTGSSAAGAIHPDPQRHELYQSLMSIYAECEAHALGRGPDPEPSLRRIRQELLPNP